MKKVREYGKYNSASETGPDPPLERRTSTTNQSDAYA
jgi:hypothetical protein